MYLTDAGGIPINSRMYVAEPLRMFIKLLLPIVSIAAGKDYSDSNRRQSSEAAH